MTNSTAATVETAIKALDAGIQKAIVRWERRKGGEESPKLRQRAKRLLANIRHCFLQLRHNQHSLKLGIQCFENHMERMDVKSAFATLLRLHDGYILTVSGECRHSGDREASLASPFPSKLHLNEAVYSKQNIYNGVAWDEWNDDKCGLRKRLCDLLQLDYDAFVETGKPAAAFETMVSETEHTLIEMQGDFKRLKLKMERVFSAKIIWRDRMEKLTSDRIHLERVGSQFQVPTALGISNMEDWDAVMKPIKKKRVIVESDDDDDEETVDQTVNPIPDRKPAAANDAHGLHVTVAPIKSNPSSKSPVDVSVNQIKQTMGVDVQKLEEARMEVEGEEEQARLEANEIDAAEPEISLPEAKLRMKRARKAYERALLSNDDTAIWNARELLREELMRMGDLLVWEDDGALRYFEQAAALVRAQQKLDAELKNDAYFGLNLLMLLCRAEINITIACIQIALRRPSRRKQCLQRACQEADAAVHHATEMRNKASNVGDRLRAFQLHALAKRHHAVALWHMYQRSEAQAAFEAAAISLNQLEVEEFTAQDYALLMECHVERYNAWTTFVDLAIGTLERAEMQSIRENDVFYSGIFKSARRAMTGAIEISSLIEETFLGDDDDDGHLVTKDVSSPTELRTALSDIEAWWKERMIQATTRIETATGPQRPTRRGDVSLPPLVSKTPSRHLIIGACNAQRRATNQTSSRRSTGYKEGRTSGSRSQPQRTLQSATFQKYRKWREDMILDETTGKWIPKLEYPAVAPPMPLEFAAILASRRASTN